MGARFHSCSSWRAHRLSPILSIFKTTPNAKIAILFANDDAGRDYAAGFKAELGSKTCQIVSELKYESSDPTVDSQVVALAATGADSFITRLPN
jgi:branched-chain amino acid transport system substrate-binding protein